MAGNTCRAISIDADLMAALAPGRVIAVYRRVCVLETERGALITLAAPELGNGPNAVLVAQRPWPVGTRFTPSGETGLWFASGHTLDWSQARRWSAVDCAPSFPPMFDHADALMTTLQHTSIATGLLPVLLGFSPTSVMQQALAQQAAPLLNALPDPEAARRLIGLGPGTTPAGDDLITGLLLTLHYARHPAADPLSTIAHEAQTTRLGRAQLAWAAAGRSREQVLLLLRDLFSQPAPAAFAALEAVLHYGATSGADLVAGIAIGLRVLSIQGSKQHGAMFADQVSLLL